MSTHYKIKALRASVREVQKSFTSGDYYKAKMLSQAIFASAGYIRRVHNISDTLYDSIVAVKIDMDHAYNFSNFNKTKFSHRLTIAISKITTQHVTESPVDKTYSVTTKGKKK